MEKNEIKIDDNKELRGMFVRSGLIFGSFNMVKMMGHGFSFAMNKTLDTLYKGDDERRKAAMVRHVEFFNCHAAMLGFILGLTYAMEKENAISDDMDTTAITNVKIALMGPLAGVGDSIFFNTIRVIAAGIAIGFAAQGNIFGTLLFIAIYGGSFLAVKWYLIKLGFSVGTSFLDTMFESGLMNTITKAASTLGLIMIGAMVATLVNINIALVPNFGGAEIAVQEVLDGIMPGLLSLVLVFTLNRLLKKGYKATTLVIGLILSCVVLAWIGVF